MRAQNELCLRRGTTQTCVCAKTRKEGSEREMAQLRRGSEKEELIRVELAGKRLA